MLGIARCEDIWNTVSNLDCICTPSAKQNLYTSIMITFVLYAHVCVYPPNISKTIQHISTKFGINAGYHQGVKYTIKFCLIYIISFCLYLFPHYNENMFELKDGEKAFKVLSELNQQHNFTDNGHCPTCNFILHR